jgi:hypothetical protein
LRAEVRFTCLREAASAKAGHAGVAFCVGGQIIWKKALEVNLEKRDGVYENAAECAVPL